MGVINELGSVLLHHSGGLHNKSFLAFRLGGRSQPLFLFSRGFVFPCSLWHYYIIHIQRVWNINIPPKEKGTRIGRVKGKKNTYYKLSKYDTYIKKQLLKGRSKLSLAKELGVTWKTLNTHLQRVL
jgi:hypothetical protein